MSAPKRADTVLVTDGPYTETKEHMGGFWILEAAGMDEALGRRHRLNACSETVPAGKAS